jgi:hypothetical protein
MNRLLITACLAVLLVAPGCGNRAGEQFAEPSGTVVELPEEIRPGLWIVQPPDRSLVPHRPVLFGTLSDTTALDLIVVVHAVEDTGSNYWVQQKVVYQPEGIWMCQPHVGLPDTEEGTVFEIRAFAKLGQPVAAGTELAGWPAAELVSNILLVARQ